MVVEEGKSAPAACVMPVETKSKTVAVAMAGSDSWVWRDRDC